MDLGINGRRAVVCGGSAGLGRAIGAALAREGVHVLLVAREPERLRETAAALRRECPGLVEAVAADVTTAEGRSALLARCPDPDILINNAGGPPVGSFRKLTRDDWQRALEANMLSAIDLINAVLDPMIERRFGRIINITSHMVKAPVAMLSLSNGARAGLTGYVAGIARELVAHNVTVNNVLPGQFDTDRLQSNHRRFAEANGQTLEAVRERNRQRIPARRFGAPDEFGATCAFLCSAHAGFMTAQNVLLDGGEYPGLL